MAAIDPGSGSSSPTAWQQVQNAGYWVGATIQSYTVGSNTEYKIVYTLIFDNSMRPDDAAREKDIAQKTARFTQALRNMKTLSEGGTLPPPPAR